MNERLALAAAYGAYDAHTGNKPTCKDYARFEDYELAVDLWLVKYRVLFEIVIAAESAVRP